MLVEVRCTVPVEVAAARIRARTGGLSEATPAIARAMAGAADPWSTATELDTEQPLAETVATAVRVVLARW